MVRRRSACLIDVYETAIRVDERRYRSSMAAHAGADEAAFVRAVQPLGPRVTVGELTLREAAGTALRGLSLPAHEAAMDAYVEADAHALRRAVTLPDDTVPFLVELDRLGVRTVIVSNCADNTRPMLADLGLLDLVEDAVLSCEVRLAKPDPAIFSLALDRLGVRPEDAVFVDDQPVFCAAAEGLGIESAVLDRASGQTLTPLLSLF